MSTMTADSDKPDYDLYIRARALEKIHPVSVDWIWPRYLASGTITALSGESGSGKTYLALAIAAALTRGKLPNDNGAGPKSRSFVAPTSGAPQDDAILGGRSNDNGKLPNDNGAGPKSRSPSASSGQAFVAPHSGSPACANFACWGGKSGAPQDDAILEGRSNDNGRSPNSHAKPSNHKSKLPNNGRLSNDNAKSLSDNGRAPNDKRRAQDVVYFNGGDSPSRVLRPRFAALGGDARRLHLLHPSMQPFFDEDDGEDDEPENIAPAPPVLSKREREAAKLAAEQTLQRLVKVGHTDRLNARQLRAIDPRDHCGTADACPASCTKCQDFEKLLHPPGWWPRSSLYRACEREEEVEASARRRQGHDGGGFVRSMYALDAALQESKARLLVVDTLDSLLEAIDRMPPARCGSAKKGMDAVPLVMTGLAVLAQEHQCCVLLLRRVHARRRGRPSWREAVDLSDFTPIELRAGASSQDAGRRTLRMSCSRIGPLAPALGYQIADDGTLTWTREVDAPALSSDQQHALREAEAFLQATLQPGRPALEVLQQARQLGISVRTLRRAKARLQIVSEKAQDGTWKWKRRGFGGETLSPQRTQRGKAATERSRLK